MPIDKKALTDQQAAALLHTSPANEQETVALITEQQREWKKQQRTAMRGFLSAAEAADVNLFCDYCEMVDTWRAWLQALRAYIRTARPAAPEIREYFIQAYLEHGASIRASVSNDLILADAYRLLLPPYTGPGLRIYRGDSARNRRHRTYGIAWSTDINVAGSFAEKICAETERESVVLETHAPSAAIICAPKEHDNRFGEDEYLVDRRRLKFIKVIKRFVAISTRHVP